MKVLFQFDNDKPIVLAEAKEGKFSFQLELTKETPNPSIEFFSTDPEKRFRISLKK